MPGSDEIMAATFRSSEILAKIAKDLGCSLETLSKPSSSPFDQTKELLRLWFMIEKKQNRDKVLEFIRVIIGEGTTDYCSFSIYAFPYCNHY